MHWDPAHKTTAFPLRGDTLYLTVCPDEQKTGNVWPKQYGGKWDWISQGKKARMSIVGA